MACCSVLDCTTSPPLKHEFSQIFIVCVCVSIDFWRISLSPLSACFLSMARVRIPFLTPGQFCLCARSPACDVCVCVCVSVCPVLRLVFMLINTNTYGLCALQLDSLFSYSRTHTHARFIYVCMGDAAR